VSEPSAADRAAVEASLGRTPAGAFTVVVRRQSGEPAVLENAPFLDDGTPMPTRYWLVDPELRAAVSRLESAGGVRRAEAEVDPTLVAEAHRRHAEARLAQVGTVAGPAPSGGVGGTRTGVKCLHAHLATYLVDGTDPVGAWTAGQLAEVGIDLGAWRRDG